MIEEALTFDDVLLQPSESSIGPGDAEVKTQLTNKTKIAKSENSKFENLKIPKWNIG